MKSEIKVAEGKIAPATKLEIFIKWFLRFGALFMLLEAIYHGSGIRLSGVENTWPDDSFLFSHFFMVLWASVSFLVAMILWIVASDVRKYTQLVLALAIFAGIHGFVLYYFSTISMETVFSVPALHVWNPWYSWQLLLEGLVLHIFSALVFWNFFKKS